MNLKDFVDAIKDLIARARMAQTWAERFALAMTVIDLIKEITSALADAPEPAMAQGPIMIAAFSAAEGKSKDELLCELESLCSSQTPEGASAAPGRPILDAALPILIALLKKFIIG